jgi:hypothetical protein
MVPHRDTFNIGFMKILLCLQRLVARVPRTDRWIRGINLVSQRLELKPRMPTQKKPSVSFRFVPLRCLPTPVDRPTRSFSNRTKKNHRPSLLHCLSLFHPNPFAPAACGTRIHQSRSVRSTTRPIYLFISEGDPQSMPLIVHTCGCTYLGCRAIANLPSTIRSYPIRGCGGTEHARTYLTDHNQSKMERALEAFKSAKINITFRQHDFFRIRHDPHYFSA